MRQLPLDMSRCNDWNCPSYKKCARHVDHLPENFRGNIPQSYFPRHGKDKCDDFIGDNDGQ